MSLYHSLRAINSNHSLSSEDTLVLFGELFNRGYANGLVEEAQKSGMTIIKSTVGRRDADQNLRPLLSEEIKDVLINVPLEAGFDLETIEGKKLTDRVKDIKLSDWEEFQISESLVLEYKKKGDERFRSQVRTYISELKKVLPKKGNVIIAHLMAGGIPRAKIFMPLMNRCVKGTGDRFLKSEDFWKSSLGMICRHSFESVTADTFDILVDETTDLREELLKSNRLLSYIAYGYHGTEVLIQDRFQWQSYTPYLQGWAKKKLESHSQKWSQKNSVRSVVYNCPEILTNSSSIFSGVEISLYTLLGSLKKYGKSDTSQVIVKNCESLLKERPDKLLASIEEYYSNPVVIKHNHFDLWPQHNSKEQLAFLLEKSDELSAFHKDPKVAMTSILSEAIIEICGKVMLHDCLNPEAAVAWIHHDVVSQNI